MKKMKLVEPDIHISNGLEQPDVLARFISEYRNPAESDPETVEEKCYTICQSPFKVCTIKGMLKEESAYGLLHELQDLQFTFKENDLLSLHQTVDLGSITSPYITAVRRFVYSELKSLVEQATGATFTSNLDLHGIKFTQHDHLMPHSDCLGTRHTAFILYLVPENWTSEFGGTLDLFSSDNNKQPVKIARSLCPQFNSFSWFEVSNTSWHQVSEVVEDQVRVSISGWFHSEDHPVALLEPPKCRAVPVEPVDLHVEALKSWVSLKYLNLEVSSEVQQQFQDDSEVSLGEFLNTDKFSALCEELRRAKCEVVGPCNIRNYRVVEEEGATLKEFMNLIRSDAFALFLSHCTGLALSRNYEDPDCEEFTDAPFGVLSAGVTRWARGNYTLLTDQEVAGLPDMLHLFYNADLDPAYDVDAGGYVSFLSRGDPEPLLVVPPQNNTLSLVYTRTDEFGFTKYVNARQQEPFYCIRAQLVPRTEKES